MRGRLRDPTTLSPDQILSRRDYAVIVFFLDELQRELETAAAAVTGDAAYVAISAQLRTFRQRCSLLADGIDRNDIVTESTPARQDMPTLYRALLRAPTLSAAAYPEGYSDTKLQIRPEMGTGDVPTFKGIILYNAGLADTLGQRCQDVHLLAGNHPEGDPDPPGLLEPIRQAAAEAGYLMVRPKDSSPANWLGWAMRAVVEGHPADGPFRSVVRRFSPLALMTLAAEGTNWATRLDTPGDGSNAVTLRLRLATGADHPIQRTYRPGAGAEGYNLAERVNAQFGIISAWPDFRHPNWRWNFLKLSYNPKMTGLQARFGVLRRISPRAQQGIVYGAPR